MSRWRMSRRTISGAGSPAATAAMKSASRCSPKNFPSGERASVMPSV
jgi:hypothetical protein